MELSVGIVPGSSWSVDKEGPDVNGMFWDDPWDGNAAAERCHLTDRSAS